MTLKLNGLEVECIIGERPEERGTEQALRIDAELEVPDLPASTDDIADAVDYAELSERIRNALVAAKCHLIERAARVALDACMASRRVLSAKVSVTKSDAVPGLTSATATIAAFARNNSEDRT